MTDLFGLTDAQMARSRPTFRSPTANHALMTGGC